MSYGLQAVHIIDSSQNGVPGTHGSQVPSSIYFRNLVIGYRLMGGVHETFRSFLDLFSEPGKKWTVGREMGRQTESQATGSRMAMTVRSSVKDRFSTNKQIIKANG
jgi:hypothetical protein